MGIAERKKREKEELRTAILNASWKIVLMEGWQALSIRKIADEIEYSVPVIYSHFENKEAIVLQFASQGFRNLNKEMKEVKRLFEGPEKQIEEMAYAYWKFAFNNKEYYQVMYAVGIPTCETVKQSKELATFSVAILDPIKDLIAKSNKPSKDIYLKLNTFWSMLHGLVSINLISNDIEDEKKDELNHKVLEDFVSVFIAGIKE